MNPTAVKIDAEIRAGKYSAGDQLPGVDELAKQFDTTVEDVNHAIGDLVYEGELSRLCGGEAVTVRNPYLWRRVGGNHSFTGTAKKNNQKPGNKILTFEKRTAWPQIIERLQLEAGEEVLVMERLLFADETPVGLEFSYMPAKYYGGVTREMFEGGVSTFALMEEQGLIPDKGVDELAVATMEPREAEVLQREVGEPVLIRFRVTLSPDGIPIKGSRAIYLFHPGYELDI
ncbi:MAG: GntR family transcriptional regulator [Brooklawnia sp.]|jgi:GntR family transcriptional regulator